MKYAYGYESFEDVKPELTRADFRDLINRVKQEAKQERNTMAKIAKGIAEQIGQDIKTYLLKTRDNPVFYEELMGDEGHVALGLHLLKRLGKKVR